MLIDVLIGGILTGIGDNDIHFPNLASNRLSRRSVVLFTARGQSNRKNNLGKLPCKLGEITIARRRKGSYTGIDDSIGSSGELFDEFETDSAGCAAYRESINSEVIHKNIRERQRCRDMNVPR
jgi:hypothetical protein